MDSRNADGLKLLASLCRIVSVAVAAVMPEIVLRSRRSVRREQKGRSNSDSHLPHRKRHRDRSRHRIEYYSHEQQCCIRWVAQQYGINEVQMARKTTVQWFDDVPGCCFLRFAVRRLHARHAPSPLVGRFYPCDHTGRQMPWWTYHGTQSLSGIIRSGGRLATGPRSAQGRIGVHHSQQPSRAMTYAYPQVCSTSGMLWRPMLKLKILTCANTCNGWEYTRAGCEAGILVTHLLLGRADDLNHISNCGLG